MKTVYVIYGNDGEPERVETTASAAKSWVFDNPPSEGREAWKIKEFQIGGTGKPRKPKSEQA